jgi:hypothetical protein
VRGNAVIPSPSRLRRVILIPPRREKDLGISLRVNFAKNPRPATRDRIKEMQRSPIAAPMNFIGTAESRNRTFVGRRGDLLRMTVQGIFHQPPR